jgi:DNA-binding protein H-NS
MENLVELQSQIEHLQKKAAQIKAKEFDATVGEIVAKMHAFGITVKDLQTALGKPGRGRRGKGLEKAIKSTKSRRSSVTKGRPAPIKYKGPNGEAWSGRGLPPKWMAALIAQGRRKEEFAV